MAQDTTATLQALSAIVYGACSWLAAGTLLTDEPPAPYTGPKPYGVWSTPGLSRAHRESGETGNQAGRPNRYTLAYYETAYVANAARQTEKARVRQTWDAVAAAAVPPDGSEDADFPASDLAITQVSLETQDRGPWIAGPDGIYIGCLIHFDLEERYSG